jgi:hypothetical protein
VVTPIARESPGVRRLAVLGLIAGAPAVLGTWIGGAAYSAALAALLLGFGAGAIVQVAWRILPSLRDPAQAGGGPTLTPVTAGGLSAGLGVMYLTGLLVG